MRNIYKKLTDDQKQRGVIFASTLSAFTSEQDGDTTHEVFAHTPDKQEVIDRLSDASFFNDSPWKYNIMRRP